MCQWRLLVLQAVAHIVIVVDSVRWMSMMISMWRVVYVVDREVETSSIYRRWCFRRFESSRHCRRPLRVPFLARLVVVNEADAVVAFVFVFVVVDYCKEEEGNRTTADVAVVVETV